MELARRLFIYGKKNEEPPIDYDQENPNQCIYDPKGKYGQPVNGGLYKGYTETELKEFWNKLKGYASYLFNKSHASTYGVITLCTMYLKCFYKAKFFAALLSMQDKKEKIALYCDTCKTYNIDILIPDINKSQYDFSEIEGNILYGFKTIKNVGKNAVDEIMQKRPFDNIEDAIKKVSKKSFNKRIAKSLIQAGAFDFENKNRFSLLNHLMDIRKDKDDRYVSETYNDLAQMQFEDDILGSTISITPWWSKIESGEMINEIFEIISKTEKVDKKGNVMAFLTIKKDIQEINALMFASNYKKFKSAFLGNQVTLIGKKTDDGKLLVNQAYYIDNEMKYII